MIKALINHFPVGTSMMETGLKYKCPTCNSKHCKHIQFLIGFEEDPLGKRIEEIYNLFIISLLLNDKVIIKRSDLKTLINLFSLSELHKMFQYGLLEIVDAEIGDAYITNVNGKIGFDYGQFNKDYIGQFEFLLKKKIKGKPGQRKLQEILLYAENQVINFDRNEIIQSIESEINSDISKKKIRQNFQIASKSLESLKFNDAIKINRLASTNEGLILAQKLKVANIVTDPFAKDLLGLKIKPSILSNLLASNDSSEIFSKFINDKGLPPFGKLYKEGVISIDHIIELRDDIHGKLFREWFKSIDYSKSEFIKVILNKNPNSRLVKIVGKVTWAIPPALAVLSGSSAAGFVAAYGSKYIGTMLKGWHPNLFFDERIKSCFHERQINHVRKITNRRIMKRSPYIAKNKPCPCGSGKKYKRCCGYEKN